MADTLYIILIDKFYEFRDLFPDEFFCVFDVISHN